MMNEDGFYTNTEEWHSAVRYVLEHTVRPHCRHCREHGHDLSGTIEEMATHFSDNFITPETRKEWEKDPTYRPMKWTRKDIEMALRPGGVV
jgi:hypothetical protein